MASPTSPPDRPDPDSIAERLKQQFGDHVEPTLPLDPEPAPDKDAPSSLFDKLRGAGTRGTRYKLLGEVARGGMGVILKIWDDELRRTLAMKVVLGRGDESKSDTPHVDPKTLGRFLEEAQVTGQLDHPGIVPVHELGLGADGRVYFTMRLVKGEDLRSIFEKVRTGEDGWNQVRALGVLLKVCEAMSYAHSKKVVHRDLKPANVMVGKFGEVYVMDWGLARVLGREDKHDLRIKPQPTTQSAVKTERREKRDETPGSPLVTMDGDIVGTPSFMPPEQAKGQLEKLGPHSDVYALGAMLYQLLTGEMPYMPAGGRVSQRMILDAVLQRPPDSIETLAPGTPAELIAICNKAMARDVANRYSTTQEFASDLRAYLEGRVVRAYETGTWAETRKWVMRNKPLAASLAAAALILIAGAVTSTTFASRATERAVALEQANTTILATNARVEAKATEAALNAAEANRLKEEALAQGRELRVRGLIQDLAQFEALDESLEYARSQNRPACQWWLERAHALVDGCEEDIAKGQHWRPGMKEVEAALAKVRLRARESTEAEQTIGRQSQSSAKKLAKRRAYLQWLSRMLGLERWPSEAEAKAQLDNEALPNDARKLNALARGLLWTDYPFRQDVKAVVLARQALKCAAVGEEPAYCDTLAWALVRCGRFDEAREEEQLAVATAEGALKEQFEANLAQMAILAQSWRDEVAQQARRAEHAALQLEVDALDREVRELRIWFFADSESEWWNDQLARLLQDLSRLTDRIAVVERSVKTPEAKRLWEEAIASITALPEYGGLRLTPQIGLLPIGADRETRLWEFAHLPSGEPAARGPSGKLMIAPDTGLVFVLLPGGRVPVETGARPAGLNEVDLDPFFLSKYEMTIEQWGRVSNAVGRMEFEEPAMVPANNVSWDDCVATLEQIDAWVWLPTAAQWEYGCRSGTTTSWWTGLPEESLRGAANLCFDTRNTTIGLQPVGQLRANRFGLHDVHGNIAEVCRDGSRFSFDDWGDSDLVRLGDGEHKAPGANYRVVRGGSFMDAAIGARSTSRAYDTPEFRDPTRGLRPARGVTP